MQDKIIEKQITVGLWSPTEQLCEASGLTREQIAEAASKGAVWHVKKDSRSKPRRVREIDKNVTAGDTVFVNYNPQVLIQKPALPVLVSDQVNYGVWFKPPGVHSQGSKWGDHTTITTAASEVCGKKCLLVHRLDRAACGLILLAYTKNAHTALCALFEKRQINKTYLTQVHGQWAQSLPLTINTEIAGKQARTVVVKAVNAKDGLESSLTVNIETGRKHQIRSHLAGLGYPVVGDRLFDPQREHQTDLKLAAYELQFDCPFSNKRQIFTLDDKLLSF